MGDHTGAGRAFDLEIAEAIAPTWAARREQIEARARPVREWLIDHLAAGPGDTVLELAAGVGDTGYAISAVIGERGRLISSDLSPAMIAEAERRAAELGVTNVEHRVIDATRIDLEDDSVDGVVCRFGLMLMPDQAGALAEIRRVLRPSGSLVLAVWGPPETNPFFLTAAMSMVGHGHLPPPEPPPAPGIFSLGSEQRLTDLLHEAGFVEVELEQIAITFEVPDVDAYLSFVGDTAGALGLALRHLSAADRDEVRSDAEQGLASFTGTAGYTIPGLAVCAAAR